MLSRCLFALLTCAAAQASGQVLHLTTEVAPPSTIVAGTGISGRSTEKLRLMMARAGLQADIDVLPWARAFQQARNHSNTCVYSAARTPAREAMFQWIGPISSIDWVLYGLADRKLRIGSLDEARPYVIGTYRDDARDEFLRGRGFRVDSVGDDALNVDKLLVGRIDLWGTTPEMARRVNMMRPLHGAIVPLLNFYRVELYLACNRALPQALIRRLTAAYESVQQDGSARAIDEKYAHWPQPPGR